MLGANGAGKSSLLKALGGMVTPQAGASAQLAGQELMQLPPHAIVQSGLALVPEGRGVFGDLSVKENLLLGAQPGAHAPMKPGIWSRSSPSFQSCVIVWPRPCAP